MVKDAVSYEMTATTLEAKTSKATDNIIYLKIALILKFNTITDNVF